MQVFETMTINKLYSKKLLVYKLIYIVLLPFLTELIAMLFNFENALVYLFSVLFSLGLFYSLPFIFTLKALRKEPLDKKAGGTLGKIILWDILYLLIPVVISTILCDSIFLILDADSRGQGVFSALVISIVVLITLAFWLLYRLLQKRNS